MDATPHHHPAHRFLLIRQIHARPRLFLSTIIGILVACFLPHSLVPHAVSRAIIGWNAGVYLYLILVMRMMLWTTHDKMRQRARQQDEGRVAVLLLVVFSGLASLLAIVGELAVVKDMHGVLRYGHIGLAVLTILSSWFFTHTMFALHYAHDYYLAQVRGEPVGLEFPGGEAPDYADFLYFSAVIGTSGQTADVSFITQKMRRVGTIHCVLAYFFNATVLALTINIASGLF